MNALPFYGALGISILLGVLAQIMLKFGADRAGEAWIAQFISPFTIAGLALYAVAFVFYVVAIRKIPLSLAFPMVAVSYFLVAIAAHYIWGEALGWPQIAGLALISGGIVLLHQV